jgi:hypothetical protein
MKKLLSVLCLVFLASPLFGQQAKSGVAGISFITPLQIAVGQDNNFLVDRSKPFERLFVLSLPPSVQPLAPSVGPKPLRDQVLMLTAPTTAYQNYSRRHLLTATYVPELEMFRTNHDQNAWNHAATGTFTYFLSRTAQISLTDEYRTSKDPVRALQNVFLLLPRSQFKENGIRAAFDVEVSAVTAFGLRYTTTRATYGQTDPFQSRILDNVTDSAGFSVRRMVRRNHRLSGTYAFYKIRPINTQRKNDDAVDAARWFEHPVHAVGVEYRIGLSPSSTLEFWGGMSTMGTGVDYTFRAAGDRRFGNMWVGAGYSRSLAFTNGVLGVLPAGLNNASFFDAFMVRAKGQLSRNIGAQFEVSAARDASGRNSGPSRSFLGKARFDYRWTDRTVTFASFDTYQQNRNDLVRMPLSRNRFLIGIEFSLASETERRTNPLNRDGQYVALTDHAVRRPSPQ